MNGDSAFNASNGWLDRWKKRHGVRQLTITGEKLSANELAAECYVTEFTDLIDSENYSPQQLYNADESGINHKALPTKSLASKEESTAPGFKMDKQRLTILACSNAAATNKLPLMVIGKSAKPRALKNMNMNSLPVYYRNQHKAWMTADLFKEWFQEQFVPAVTKFNEENGLPNKALLLVDNAPSHPSDKVLVNGNIKAIFLPPNVTSILQPMDQGVLQNIKLYYRKMLLRSLIEDDGHSIKEKLKQITIKDVIYWTAEAWNNCSKCLIQKSWKNLWPSLSFQDAPIPVENLNDDVLLLVQQIPGCEDARENSLREWFAADSDCQNYSDEEIISMVQDNSVNVEESEDDEDADTELVSHADAANAFEIAIRYIEQHSAATPNDVMFVRRWRNIASSSRISSLRQKKITDFCKQ